MNTHSHFADWYSRANVGVTADALQPRWEGVTTFADSANADGVLDLVRLYLRAPLADESFADGFRTAIKDKDQLFKMSDNDQEVALLAGAALVYLLEQEPNALSDLAALAVRSADLNGLRRTGPFHDVVPIAAQYLSKAQASARTESNGSVATSSPGSGWDENLKALKAQLPNNNAQQMGDIVLKLLSPLANACRTSSNAIMKLDQQVRVYREEANIAWWILGEHSRSAAAPIRGMGKAAPVICGADLADLVEVMPGPATASALLARMLAVDTANNTTPVTVKDAVNAPTAVWRSAFVKSRDVGSLAELAPLSFAIRQAVETPDAWVAVFESRVGVLATATLAPAAMAQQAMTECLLARSRAESESE